MTCEKCYAPVRKYCPEGLECKLNSDADFVMTLNTKEQRNTALLSMKKNSPAHYEALREKMKARYAAKRVEAA